MFKKLIGISKYKSQDKDNHHKNKNQYNFLKRWIKKPMRAMLILQMKTNLNVCLWKTTRNGGKKE